MVHILRQGYLRGDVNFPATPNNRIILTITDPENVGQVLEGKWVTTLTVYLDSTLLGAFDAVMDFIEHLQIKYFVNERFSPYTTDPLRSNPNYPWCSFNIIIFDNTGQSYRIHLDNMEIKIVETLTSQTQYKIEVINGQYLDGLGTIPVWRDYELPESSRCILHTFVSALVKPEEWCEKEEERREE